MSDDDSTRAPGGDELAYPLQGNPKPRPGPSAHERCPHCGTIAVLEPSNTLRWVCGVCGRARVPIDDATIERRYAEKDALLRATTARNASRAWSVTAAAASVFAAFSFLFLALTVWAASPPMVATLLAVMAALTPVVLAAYAFQRAKATRAGIEPALEEGWATAARDAAEGRGSIDPDELATLLRIDTAFAERLLANLSTLGAVRARIDDEGSALSFQADAPRARVGKKTKKKPVAEEEALADEEAAAAAADEEAREDEGRR